MPTANKTPRPATPYLDRLAALAPKERWPFARDLVTRDPRGFFAELRAHAPIFETPDVTLLAKRADVIEALSVPKVFTVDLYRPKMGDFMLAQDETVVNYRDKSVMRAILTWDDLPKVRALVGEVADAILAGAPDGRIELVSQFARIVPLRLVQRYFGIEGPDADLLDWSYANQMDQFNNLPYDGRPDAEAIHAAAEESRVKLRALFATLIPARIAAIKAGTAPDDSLTRILKLNLPESAHFGMDRVVINVGGLLIGAIETTAEAVVNALAELFARPEVLAGARAAAARDDDSLDGYVWEALRFSPIVAFMFREAASTYTLAKGTAREKVIGKGTVVLPLSLSAMFDPDFVEAPEAFRPDRPFHTYLHFGYGHHECLGRYVGAVMIPEMVRRVLKRPAARPLGPVDMAGTPFPQSWPLALS
ncbi:cytochrome P450 [Xanthobacter agilis]|uniref:Cytochrome P450 n=1 Tax=Xanthobacter agilis TaxID=47492 RepID=A0ABU0LFS6_XANAG|nr:cytochrome P450 [Xanthobacter agilis]MDQ0505920.1 cytochrome P450 [Xanthobacter agilis]